MYYDFRVIDKIHKSNRTEVYRAIRESDGTSVILKTRGKFVSRTSEHELQYEFELGKSLAGNHSLEYLSIENSAKESFIVMRDDKMESLLSVIPENGFDLSTFFNLAIEIVSAIEEIHKQGIIHKDINPANIIVNTNLDKVKIIDFGFATRIIEEVIGFQPSNVLQGTIAYISPEQTGRTNKPVDSRSDLYSLGITLYQLITGVVPFEYSNQGELIYSHIANIPTPVSKIKQKIPVAVSLVIEKLLMKSPDERYQTCSGLRADIIALQWKVMAGDNVDNFIAGENERSERLSLAGKLYGREEEISKLISCFDDCELSAQLLTIRGGAGIGKTSLVRELYVPITQKGGFFLSGKFDQFNKGLLHGALFDLLRGFVHQCSQDAIETWCDIIQSSVGDFGQVLTDIVPELEKIIGRQADVVLVPPQEALVRRNLVFSNLIKGICESGKPVVIFLDELQWSDSSTLSLLEVIIELRPKRLFIILSFREDELSSINDLNNLVNSAVGNYVCNDKRIATTDITLKNISEKHLHEWVCDCVPDISENAAQVSGLIFAKTEGNPFYISSILHLIFEKGFIKYNENGLLILDLDAIANIPAESDIVFYLIGRINSLDEKTRQFLIELSVLGNRSSIDILDLIFATRKGGYEKYIRNLVRLHLLVKSGNNILFAHNRIIQAARAQIQDDKANALHLQYGQIIKSYLDSKGSNDSKEEYIGEYIHHFNQASDLITDHGERLELIRLNIIFGKSLKDNAEYQTAESYFAHAVSFLPTKKITDIDQKLATNLLIDYGEILFLNHKYEEGEKQFNKVISQTNSPIIKANIYSKQIVHYAYHHDPIKSVEIAFKALEILGVKFPKRFCRVHFYIELIRVFISLRNKKPEDILSIPVTKNEKAVAQMQVLSAASAPTYISFPEIWPNIILKMVRITIKNGNCCYSPACFIPFAAILCNMGFVDSGYSLGKDALKSMKDLGVSKIYTVANHRFAMLINHWKAPVRESIGYLEAVVTSGLKTGNYEYASLALLNKVRIAFYSGESIDSLLMEFPKRYEVLEKFGKSHSILMAKHWNQFLLTINNPSGDGITVSGEAIDEDWLIPFLKERKLISGLEFCMFSRMQLAYLARDFELANRVRIDSFESIIEVFIGTIYVPIAHFFNALIAIEYYRNHSCNRSILKEAKSSLKKLQKWGKKAPENFLYKAQLIEAELNAVNGKHESAIKLYQLAVDNSENAGNSLDYGIACECMGRYLLNLGLRELGLVQIRKGFDAYDHWGARNKSTKLSDEFEFSTNKEVSFISSSASSHSSQEIYEKIDFEALAGTITSLTGDLNFNSLLETLLDTLIHSSGATRVIYLQQKDDNLSVKAEKKLNEDILICNGSDSRPVSFELPISLIEKCQLDPSRYVLDNVVIDGKIELNKKSNVTKKQPIRLKSVLLIPLVRKNDLKGIVYLENDLMQSSFRDDQVYFLTLLAGQAVIALENAVTFENLNDERNYSSNIINNAPSLISGIDREGITTFINPAIEAITGYSSDEIIGSNWWKLFYPNEEYKQVEELFKIFSSGNVKEHEMLLTCLDGSKKNIVWNYSIKKEDNNIIEVIGFGNDITNRKKAETQLQLRTDELYQANVELIQHKENLQELVDGRTRELKQSLEELKQAQEYIVQTEKMSALGGLVAGVAHEINTPVGIGVTAASHLQDKTEKVVQSYKDNLLKRGDLEEYFNLAEKSSMMILVNMTRAADLIQSFKQVAVDRSSEQMRSFKLKDYIEEVLLSLYSELKKTPYLVELDCPADLILNTYPGAIFQILTNLVMNSVIHGFDGADSGTILIKAWEAEGNIEMIFQDNGKGISDENLNKIFDPFFTTKRGQGGSGLGMHIVYNLITQTLKGNISCSSVVGQGSIFELHFPIDIDETPHEN